MTSIEEDILDRFQKRLTEAAEGDQDIWLAVRTALGEDRLPTPDKLLGMLSETSTAESMTKGVPS